MDLIEQLFKRRSISPELVQFRIEHGLLLQIQLLFLLALLIDKLDKIKQVFPLVYGEIGPRRSVGRVCDLFDSFGKGNKGSAR